MKKFDVVENTGHAAKGANGYEYQFLYFINRLLKMVDKGDIVSYEKHDDVSMFSGEKLIYFQLKHTIGGCTQNPVNLSLRDHRGLDRYYQEAGKTCADRLFGKQ